MKALKEALTPLAILLLAGVVVYDHVVTRPAVAPAPAVNGTALGKTYAPALLASYADAWTAAAKVLEDGKPIAEAQKTLQETWKEALIKAFTAEVACRDSPPCSPRGPNRRIPRNAPRSRSSGGRSPRD